MSGMPPTRGRRQQGRTKRQPGGAPANSKLRNLPDGIAIVTVILSCAQRDFGMKTRQPLAAPKTPATLRADRSDAADGDTRRSATAAVRIPEFPAATPVYQLAMLSLDLGGEVRNGFGRGMRAALAPAGNRPNRTGLPDRLKAGIEALSGFAMDDVRVHYNSAKPAAVQALAYTQGTDIHVGPGQERHLPHEAWHAVQQKQGRVKPTLQTKGVAINDDGTLEREADRMGKRAATHAPRPQEAPLQRTTPVRVGAMSLGDGSHKVTAAQDGRPAGSLRLHDRGRGTVEVTDLGVEATHRGAGVGHQLLHSALRTVLRLGGRKVSLNADDKGSGRLINWYQQMGFRRTGANLSGLPRLEAHVDRALSRTAPHLDRQADPRPGLAEPSARMFPSDHQHVRHPGRPLQKAKAKGKDEKGKEKKDEKGKYIPIEDLKNIYKIYSKVAAEQYCAKDSDKKIWNKQKVRDIWNQANPNDQLTVRFPELGEEEIKENRRLLIASKVTKMFILVSRANPNGASAKQKCPI
jgi:GNAT superfamily N-acetyltransferase